MSDETGLGAQKEVAFSGVTSQSITQFIEESKTLKRTVWLRRVRAWARQQRGE